jgi:RNA recognition motif-containing protein
VDEELRELFSQAGAVANVQVMRDAATGRARGFGFVEMATEDGAQKAVALFNQYEMQGRALVVNEAKPRGAGGDRSFGDGNRGGYGGGGGGAREPREPRW